MKSRYLSVRGCLLCCNQVSAAPHPSDVTRLQTTCTVARLIDFYFAALASKHGSKTNKGPSKGQTTKHPQTKTPRKTADKTDVTTTLSGLRVELPTPTSRNLPSGVDLPSSTEETPTTLESDYPTACSAGWCCTCISWKRSKLK